MICLNGVVSLRKQKKEGSFTMKKAARQSFAILMAVLMLLSVMPLGVFAAGDDTIKCAKCGTAVKVTQTTEPTCTKAGVKTGTCSNCKSVVTIAGDKALGHEAEKDANGNVVYADNDIIPAQCGVAGAKYGHCKRCGERMTDVKEEIPAQQHEWVIAVADQYLKNMACCIAPETYYKHCKNCGKSAGELSEAEQAAIEGGATFVKEGSKIDPDTHLNVVDDPDPAVPAQAPSCTSNGWVIGTVCKDCGRTVKEGYAPGKTPHVAAEGKEATCVSKAICKNCGAEFGELDPENHANVVADLAVAPTCDKDGLTAGSHCEACHTTVVAQKKQNKLAEDGKHTFGATWTFPKNYDCAVGGIITRKCEKCDFVEEKEIAANAHVAVVDPAVAPTCTATGLGEGEHCAFCNLPLKAQETVAALGHDFKGAAVSKDNGTHAFHCTRCDAVGVGTQADVTEDCTDADYNCVCDVCGYQLEHKFETYISDNNATCVEDGTETATCSVCQKATDKRTEVGSHLNGAHQFGKYESQNDATCLKNAHEIAVCALCKKQDVREIANSALGHDLSDWIYAPTFDCEVGGLRYKECKREGCGELFDEENVPPAEHTEVTDEAVPVTCTTDGWTEGIHCSVCGKVIRAQDVIVHKGHQAEESAFKVTKEPTCTEKGSKEATCTACNQLFTVEIPALDHDFKETKVAPTCTTNGYTERVCQREGCGYTDKVDVVKKLGHDLKTSIRPAEWGKNGKSVSVCRVCKERISEVIYKIASIQLSETTFIKDGKAKTPTVTVKDAKGKVLKYKTDYTLTYPKGRKNLGSYMVTINFKGKYAGTKTRTFNITIGQVGKPTAKSNANSVALSWSRVKYATQYVIYRSATKNGAYKKVAVTDGLAYTVTKLNPATAYFFKVKAVRKDANGTYVGAASAPVGIRTAKAA